MVNDKMVNNQMFNFTPPHGKMSHMAFVGFY